LTAAARADIAILSFWKWPANARDAAEACGKGRKTAEGDGSQRNLSVRAAGKRRMAHTEKCVIVCQSAPLCAAAATQFDGVTAREKN
jgi:hypothetical protein